MDRLIKYLRSSWPFWLGLCGGLYWISFTIIGIDFSHFAGDLGDGRLNLYFLEHGYKYLSGQVESYWNAPFFHPEEKVMTMSSNLLGTVPFYAFFRTFGLDRETAFQCWYLLVTVLNFAACYLFLNYVFKNRYAAVLGAMVFAFGVAIYPQLASAQTFTRMGIPLSFLMAVKFIRSFQPRYFLLTLLMFVYQVYCGIYLGFMLFLPLTAMLVSGMLLQWKALQPCVKELRWWGGMISVLTIALILMWPLASAYLEHGISSKFFTYDNLRITIPTPRSFLYSHNGTLLWEGLRGQGVNFDLAWIHQMFPGAIALSSMVFFIVVGSVKKWRQRFFNTLPWTPTLSALLITTLVTFLFFTQFGGYSLYRLLFELPGFYGMRLITRVINIEMLLFAVATTLVFTHIFSRNRSYNGLLFVVFMGLLIADNYIAKDNGCRTEKSIAQDRTQMLVDKMNHLPPGSIISYEPDTLVDPHFVLHLDAMMASQYLDLTCVNGYSSTSPWGYMGFWYLLNEEERIKWFEHKHYHSAQEIHVIK